MTRQHQRSGSDSVDFQKWKCESQADASAHRWPWPLAKSMSCTSYQSSAGSLAVLLQRAPYRDGPNKDASFRWPAAAGSNNSSLRPLAATATSSRLPSPTWLVSKGHALLSVSVTPSSCRLRLGLQEHCLIDQAGQEIRLGIGPHLVVDVPL